MIKLPSQYLNLPNGIPPRFRKVCIFIPLIIGFLEFLSIDAFADTPMGYGIFTYNSPVFLSSVTYGTAAVGIIIIEAIVLKFMLKYRWIHAFFVSIIINIFSTLIGGILSCGFAGGLFLLFILVGLPAFAYSFLGKYHPPKWFLLASISTFIVGEILTAHISIKTSFFSPVYLLIDIELTLLAGFGASMMTEAFAMAGFFKEHNFWKALTYANVASYLLLLFLFPFFSPNPYEMNSMISYKISDYIKEDNSDKALKLIDLRYSNMQYLLGITKTNTISNDDYSKYDIYQIFEHKYSKFPMNKTAKAVLDAYANIPNLNPESALKINWLRKFYEFYFRAEDAIKTHNQVSLNQIYFQWSTWNNANPYPNHTVYEYDSWDQDDIDPSIRIDLLLSDNKSRLKNPSPKYAEKDYTKETQKE